MQPGFKNSVDFPFGLPSQEFGGLVGPQALTRSSPIPLQAVPVPDTIIPQEPRTERTATCGECGHLWHVTSMSPEEGVTLLKTSESEARAGWWEPLPKCLCSNKSGAKKGLEPLPSFSACLRGSRRCPGAFWPRWSQPSLPKPDGGSVPAVPPAGHCRSSGLTGNCGVLYWYYWHAEVGGWRRGLQPEGRCRR